MTRNRYIVLLLAALAWIVVAIVLSNRGGSSAHTVVPPSGPSPACLPASLSHDALLPGTTVAVSPAPETDTANPGTQISFLGTPVTSIREVSVTGSRSGAHTGRLAGYSQGDGASFLPEKPFRAGERVTVRLSLGAGAGAGAGSGSGAGAGSGSGAGAGSGVRQRSFSFRVATPYPTAGIPSFPNPPAPASAVQSFASAPGLHPPILQVTAPDRDPSAGDVLMTAGPGPGQYGPLIYGPDGRLIWFGELPKGVNALNLSVQRYHGGPALTWWQGRVLALGFGEGEDVVMDSSYQTAATVHAGNGYEADLHDFQLAPDDVAYITVYNVMRCDLSPVRGPRNGVIVDNSVQALDLRTGLVRWEWHALDHVDVRESHTPMTTGAKPWDWLHLNSIDVEPSGDLLLSGRSTWAAYQLDRASGRVAWQLGGTGSSFTMGPGTETAWQHDARLQPDGAITSFDDGSNPRVHYQSRGLRVALDRARRRASVVRAYPHPGGPLLADSQGNMQTLPSGNLVIGWGAIPSVTEMSAGGALLFDAHLPAGFSSYRAFRSPWHGQPLWQPAASAHVLVTGDSTAVSASWNGATEVVSWRVLAGPDGGSLSAKATMPDSGFESSVTFPDDDPEKPPAYVAVQALDASGRVLGTSPTVKVQR